MKIKFFFLAFLATFLTFGETRMRAQESPWQLSGASGQEVAVGFVQNDGRTVMRFEANIVFKAPYIYMKRPYESKLPEFTRLEVLNLSQWGKWAKLHAYCIGDSIYEPFLGKEVPALYHANPPLALGADSAGWQTIEMQFPPDHVGKNVHFIVLWFELINGYSTEYYHLQVDQLSFRYRVPGIEMTDSVVVVDDMDYLPTRVVAYASDDAAAGYALGDNYPNPFNPTTTINFSLPKSGSVVLTVFNALGQEIETLVDANMPAGFHTVVWNAKNLPSGVYYYRIETSDFRQTNPMVLAK